MLRINSEFRKGIMFIRINGNLNKKNIDNIYCEDFKYIVFNFDNLLSIDSYAIKYIINYNEKMEKINGKLLICETNTNFSIDNELKAFNIL